MMQAYIDEMYYINDYLEGRKPVTATGLPFYARSASQTIDRYTFNRLKDITEVPGEIQTCCCELVESEHRMEKQQKESGGKASEKISTYSVSFSSAQELVQATAKEQRSIAMKWLADSGLCCQGV